jgi:hypothetical protein
MPQQQQPVILLLQRIAVSCAPAYKPQRCHQHTYSCPAIALLLLLLLLLPSSLLQSDSSKHHSRHHPRVLDVSHIHEKYHAAAAAAHPAPSLTNTTPRTCPPCAAASMYRAAQLTLWP